MWLFVIFIAWPLIEIGLFVTLGGWLGLWLTLAVVLGSAVAGMAIIRRQGTRAVADARQSLSGLQRGGKVADGVLVVLAGALLILPGFLTDAIGLVLLIPPVRHLIFARLARKVVRASGSLHRGPEPHRHPAADVIDGEFTEIEGPKTPTHSPSGWTRH